MLTMSERGEGITRSCTLYEFQHNRIPKVQPHFPRPYEYRRYGRLSWEAPRRATPPSCNAPTVHGDRRSGPTSPIALQAGPRPRTVTGDDCPQQRRERDMMNLMRETAPAVSLAYRENSFEGGRTYYKSRTEFPRQVGILQLYY